MFTMIIVTDDYRSTKWIQIDPGVDRVDHGKLDTMSKAILGVGPCGDEVKGLIVLGTDKEVVEMGESVAYFMATRVFDIPVDLRRPGQKIKNTKTELFIKTVVENIMTIWEDLEDM